MRRPSQPCKEHNLSFCWRQQCKEEEQQTIDNAGSDSISPLAIDTSDGSLGFQVGGIAIDT